MDEADRTDIVERLRASRGVVAEAVSGVSDADALRHPDPSRWSILDCVEHLATAENMLLQLISHHRAAAPEPENSRKLESVILRHGTDRSRKFEAPDIARPTGLYASLDAALTAFQAQRDRTIAWVESCPDDLRGFTADHPVFGPRTCQQILATIPIHSLRHAEQIGEIRSAIAADG